MSIFRIIHTSPRGRREVYVLARSSFCALNWAQNRYGVGVITVAPARRKA